MAKARNQLIAKVRAAVERPFAVYKEQYGLRRMRFYNLLRNRVHIALACCAYNLRRATCALAKNAAHGKQAIIKTVRFGRQSLFRQLCKALFRGGRSNLVSCRPRGDNYCGRCSLH